MNLRQKYTLYSVLEDKEISIQNQIEKFDITIRMLRYDIKIINKYTEKICHKELLIVKDGVITFEGSEEDKSIIKKQNLEHNFYELKLNQENRLLLILFDLCWSTTVFTIQELADRYFVSRATINTDLIELKKMSQIYHINIKSIRGKGIYIQASEDERRNHLAQLIKNIKQTDYDNSFVINQWFRDIDVQLIENIVIEAERKYELWLTDICFEGLVVHICLAIKRHMENIDYENKLINLKENNAFDMARYIVEEVNEHFSITLCQSEIIYIAVRLNGKLGVMIQEENYKSLYIDYFCVNMVVYIGEKIGRNFKTDEKLINDLIFHLRTAFYRYRNHMVINNPLKDELIDTYPEIYFHISKYIEENNKGIIVLSDDEIGYILLHFASSLNRLKEATQKIPRVLVVCSTGVGTAELVASSLNIYFRFNIVAKIAKHQINHFLASYLFYGIAGLEYIPFLVITTISAYYLSIKLGQVQDKQDTYFQEHNNLTNKEKKEYKKQTKQEKKKYMKLVLLLNLGILAVVKYTNFMIFNINSVFSFFEGPFSLTYVNLIVPLGISFYTFQTLSYVFDIYYNKYPPTHHLGKFALYVSFFPQLLQGPISRYNDLSQTMFQEHRLDKENVCFGIQRIMWGFFKKLVIGDRIAILVLAIFNNPSEFQGIYVLVGILCYGIQLYGDFSGGIDITIGVAQLFGITVKENFRRPYFSKSLQEFWKRWHISMGSWFSDYLFYPLSLSPTIVKITSTCRKKFGNKLGKRVPVYIATILVWLATGIWHGASWSFVAWGLTNCFIMLVSQELVPFYVKFHEKFHLQNNSFFRLFQIIRTYLLVSFTRLFDCYGSVPVALTMFQTIFTTWNIQELGNGNFLQLGLTIYDYMILFISIMLLIIVSLKQRKGSIRHQIQTYPYSMKVCIWYGLFLTILLFGIYGIGYEQSQFIYNRF